MLTQSRKFYTYDSPIVNSSARLPTWVEHHEQEFLKETRSGIRREDTSARTAAEFWRIAKRRGLIRSFRGYARPRDSEGDSWWVKDRRRVLHNVNYLERVRVGTKESRPISKSTTSKDDSAVAYSGPTAAYILGLPLINQHPPKPIRQVGPSFTGFSSRNCVTRQVSYTPETIEFLGFRISSPAQIVVDLALTVDIEHSLACANFVLHNELCTAEDIADIYHRLPRVRGIGRVRRVLELMDSRIESVGESLLLLRLDEFGLTPVTPQVNMSLGGAHHRVDFMDRKNRLVYEFDGVEKLVNPQMRSAEGSHVDMNKNLARDLRIRRAGFDPVHLVYKNVKTREGFGAWLEEARTFGFPL